MGTTTITLDTKAFDAETSTRAQQRGQRVLRGTIAGSDSYAEGGDTADLSPYFPAGNYRVILSPLSTTGVHLGVYDHANKKLKIFSALNTEASGDLHATVFSFIVLGE